MAGGTRELTNPADMPRVDSIKPDYLIPAANADGEPIAIRGAAFVDANSDIVRSTEIRRISRVTQAAYNALNPKDASTLYIIVG